MTQHQDVKDFYDKTYYVNEHQPAKLPWHTRKIAKQLNIKSGDHVLDIACGSGAWLQELKNKGAKVSGLDISEHAIALAKQQLPEADLRVGIAEKLPFEGNQFDLITCMGSLEHFLDQPLALKEMRRVAKPDARYLILVPNAGFLTRRLGLYQGTQQTLIKETVLSLQAWEAMLNEAGLSVQATWKDLHPLNTQWITLGSPLQWPIRLGQAAALPFWPVAWQYQVYFWCTAK